MAEQNNDKNDIAKMLEEADQMLKKSEQDLKDSRKKTYIASEQVSQNTNEKKAEQKKEQSTVAVEKETQQEDKELEEEKPQQPSKKKDRKKKSVATYVTRGLVLLAVILSLYGVVLFSTHPFIVKWRTLYIETAMSTTSHQWLATAFFPKSMIEEIMNERTWKINMQAALDSGWDDVEDEEISDDIDAEALFYKAYWEIDSESVRKYLKENPKLTEKGYGSIVIKDMDGELGLYTVNGHPLLALDTANNLMIIKIHQDGYQGKLALVKNPKQIEMAKSDYLGSRGQIIDDYGEKCDALLAINASGFIDVDGHGSGGEIRGSLVIDGKDYGNHKAGKSHWKFIGMKKDNRLYVTHYDRDSIPDYKWACEFSPALIVDGEIVAEGSYGWGIQPRSVIGQSANGTFMLLLIDGRQPGYSIGCTVGDCAKILYEYKAYQAVNLDGGSSAIMWYDGEQITKSSSPTGFGRYLPNAIVVRKASDIVDKEDTVVSSEK